MDRVVVRILDELIDNLFICSLIAILAIAIGRMQLRSAVSFVYCLTAVKTLGMIVSELFRVYNDDIDLIEASRPAIVRNTVYKLGLNKNHPSIRARAEVISGAENHQVILFGVFAVVLLALNLYCFILRAQSLSLFKFSYTITYSRTLLAIIYTFGTIFVFSTLVSAFSWHMDTARECSSAIYLCLVFYLGGKVFLYLFLVERVRCINQTTVDRCADILWQQLTWLVLSGFGQIAIVCFYYPVDSTEHGYCTIGLPTFITTPMLAFDVSLNLIVSAIFYCLSRREFAGVADAIISPNIRRFFHIRLVRTQGSMSLTWRKLDEMPRAEGTNRIMAYIIRKTLLVSVLILFSTIANLALLFYYRGAEHGWLCFLTCSLDVTWNVMCVTYLVAMPTKDEVHNITTYLDQEEEFRDDSNV